MPFFVHWSDDVMSYDIREVRQDGLSVPYPSRKAAEEAAKAALEEWGPNDKLDNKETKG